MDLLLVYCIDIDLRFEAPNPARSTIVDVVIDVCNTWYELLICQMGTYYVGILAGDDPRFDEQILER